MPAGRPVIAAVFLVAGVVFFVLTDARIADAQQIGPICVAIAMGVAICVLRTTSKPEIGMVRDDNGLWFRDRGLPPAPRLRVADAYPIGVRPRP